MNLKIVCTSAACALLMGVAPLAGAWPASLVRFKNHALPVLVTVNSQGEVTRFQPAYEMPQAMRRLLKTTLDQLITGPSIEHGKGIASQAVIQLAIEAVPQDGGRFKVHFAYVDAMPVPYGSWFWNHIDGHRLALQADTGPAHRYRYSDMPRPYRSHVRVQPVSHGQPRPVQHTAPARPMRAMPVPVRKLPVHRSR